MADPKDLAEAEAYAVLAAGISGADIYQDVPENHPLPLVVLGDSSSTTIGGKGDPDEKVTINIVTLVSAEEKAPLTALQGQIKSLLREHKASVDGFTLHFTFESDDAQLHENGVHYVGTTTFSVFALAA